jgi:hypothetical protein
MPKGERLQDVKDWTSELIRASECRSIYYSSRNSTFQKQWIDALRYLKENRKKIYVQKGGEHKGKSTEQHILLPTMRIYECLLLHIHNLKEFFRSNHQSSEEIN